MKKISFSVRRPLGAILALVLVVGSSQVQADDIFSNPIEGTNPNTSDPYTTGQTFNSNITVSGIGRGPGIAGANANNRYNANGWNTPSIDFDAYFYWTLTPNEGFYIDFNSFSGTWQASGTGPNSYALYSSLDSENPIQTGSIATGTTSAFSFDLSAEAFSSITGDITFYLYAWGATNAGGTFSINDFVFDGLVLPSGGGNEVSIGPGNVFTPDDFGGSPFTASDVAVFDGVPTTVTLSGNVVAEGLKFTESGYILAGGESDSIASKRFEVAEGVVAEISGTITGDNELLKMGDGQLTLSGENDFVGNVSILFGTLAIQNDSNLGNEENDVVLSSNGQFMITESVALGAARDISGTGAIYIPQGEILTVAGSVNATLTLTGSGMLQLNGASNTLGGLNTEGAAVLDLGGNTVNLNGNISSSQTEGTVFIENGILELGAALRTITVADGAEDVDFDISAAISSQGTRLHKLGEGTLRLAGDNSGLYGVRLGTANGETGGTLIVTDLASLGTSQFQFNHGRLHAENDIEFYISLSIGGVEDAKAVITGGNLIFSGDSSFFITGGKQSWLEVNNHTTLLGSLTYSSSFGGTGLTLAGEGILLVEADAYGVAVPTTVEDTLRLIIMGQWGSDITVQSEATLEGNASIYGNLNIQGTLNPGREDSKGMISVDGDMVLAGLTVIDVATEGMSGVDYDAFFVGGSMTYGGQLDLYFENLLDLGAHLQLFEFLPSAEINGNFASVKYYGAFGEGSFSYNPAGYWVAYIGEEENALRFNLQTGELTYAIPEPQVMALVLAAMIGLAAARYASNKRLS